MVSTVQEGIDFLKGDVKDTGAKDGHETRIKTQTKDALTTLMVC